MPHAKKSNIKFKLGYAQGGLCHWCEEPTDAEDMTLEHIVPRVWGGVNLQDINLVMACKWCNVAKDSRVVPDHCEKCIGSFEYHFDTGLCQPGLYNVMSLDALVMRARTMKERHFEKMAAAADKKSYIKCEQCGSNENVALFNYWRRWKPVPDICTNCVYGELRENDESIRLDEQGTVQQNAVRRVFA